MGTASRQSNTELAREQVQRLMDAAHRALQHLRDRNEPKTTARAMFSEQSLEPVDQATAERRFAHLPLEDDR